MFWSIERLSCLSSSLAWHRTPGQVENARGRIFYRVLQPPACGQLGLRQRHKGKWLTNSRHFLSQFCQLEVRGQGSSWASSAASPSGCQTADLPVSSPGVGPGTQATQDSRRTIQLPFVRALLSSPPLASTQPPQRCHLLGIGVQLMDLGGTQAFSP